MEGGEPAYDDGNGTQIWQGESIPAERALGVFAILKQLKSHGLLGAGGEQGILGRRTRTVGAMPVVQTGGSEMKFSIPKSVTCDKSVVQRRHFCPNSLDALQ